MKFLIKLMMIKALSFIIVSHSQETLPIYQDYLSDNVYLIHPAAAGIGECGKIRLTARSQWLGISNVPELQTLSFHVKIKQDSKSAYGLILFNDKNGFHSQKAIQGTYAYHLNLDRKNVFNQLSFGLSFSAVQNEVNQTSFSGDPVVQQIIDSDFYINADFGLAYHVRGFSGYLTIKNIFLSAKDDLNTDFYSLNLRNYILGAGYFFGNKDNLQYEPSFMFQFKEQTGEKIADINIKIYKKIKKTQLWTGLSYRNSFDSNTFEEARYFSPVLGVNHKKFMISYTYTKQFGQTVFSDAGFHQISLGLNVLCGTRRLPACPNVNDQLF